MTKENQILIELLADVNRWADLKKKLELYNTSQTETTTKKTVAGKIFETFCKYYFLTDPEKIDLYQNVWLYEEVPLKVREELKLPSVDHGIDILLKDVDSNYHAVQCKYKNDELKSLSWSGDKIANVFALGTNCQKVIVFSNVSDVTRVAKAFSDKYEQILNDTLLDLDRNTFIRILSIAKGKEPPKIVKYTPKKHQQIAINQVLNHFVSENRGQLILPCGAGKTLTALWIKEGLKANNTLVLVPSLALLRQIKNDWARHKNTTYRSLYVCSEKDIDKGVDSTVTHAYEIGGPVTTNYINVQSFLENKSEKIVFSTYQSIGVVSMACERIPGFEFDLVTCDEAHRTAGSTNKNTFTIVHDNKKLPAIKRLYMTATPKVASTSLKTKLGDEYELLCDMSNPAIFGGEAYRMSFGEAIDENILVDYQIIGIGVTDKEVKKYIEEREFIGQITAEELAHNFALELVMNKYGAFHGLTFHSRVILAKEFAERHSTYFNNIYSESVNGKQSTTYRKKVLDEFKNSEKGIVSNARCLTEGVDVPSIDLIYFCDPKTSKIDIVQASGRALRKDPTRGKVRGYIVIPIFHHIEENLEDEIKKKPIFNYLIQVVRAMCDQDERLEAEINEIASKKGKRSNSKLLIDFQDKEIEKIIKLEGLEKKLQNVLFDEIIEKTKDFWQVMFIQLCEFLEVNNHLDVSRNEDPRLSNWIYEQRRKNRSRKLNPAKRQKLDSIGFDWKSEDYREEGDFDDIWWASYLKLVEYHKQNGDADVPARYKADKPLGTWVVAQRAKKRKGELSPERVEFLDDLDFSWDAKIKIFDQFCTKLTEFKAKYGHTRVPTISKDFPKLGKWTNKYRSILNNGEVQKNGAIKYSGSYLSRAQITKLKELGFKNSVRKTHWEDYYADLEEFFKQYGHSRPVQSEFPQLYYWVYKTRKNLASLTDKQISLLQLIDFDFTFENKYKHTGNTQNWEERLAQLEVFADENEHFNITSKNEEFEGLYAWLVYQRRLFNNGTLDSTKIEKLKGISFDFTKDFLPLKESDWESKFEGVKDYLKNTGSFYIPSKDNKNRPLMSWLRYQRKLYRDGKLDKEKEIRLLEIGYSFTHSYQGKKKSKTKNDEAIWNNKLEQLKAYHMLHKTFLIPSKNEDYRHLIPWLQYQKKLKRDNNISPIRESKLLSIGFSFELDYRGKSISSINRQDDYSVNSSNNANEDWLQKLKELETYHLTNKTFRIPSNDKRFQPLRSWVQYQKTLYRTEKLSEEKISKLKEIGYSFDLDFRGRLPNRTSNITWHERFEELKFYHSQYKTFLIPKSLTQYVVLKKWLTEQKRQYKLGKLGDEKIQKFQDIGYSFKLNYQGKKFDYEISPDSRPENKPNQRVRNNWESTYLELINYKIINGNCNVPRGHSNSKLVNFVSRNRSLFKKSELENEKVEKLKLIGFEFTAPQSRAWQTKFDQLKVFYEKTGHSNYQKKDGNPSIYHWILGQRVAKRKNILDQNRISKLNSIKFIWEPSSKGSSPREDEWLERLLELKAYKDKYGNANVSQTDPNNRALGRWLNDQRVYKKGKKLTSGEVVFLSEEREELLKDVGVAWDMKEYEWDTKLELLNSFYKANGHFNIKQKDKNYKGLYYWLFKIKKSGTTKERILKLKNIGFDISLIKPTESD